ncbi:MAG: hypothetical protein ACRYG8_48665, partial [Janthinobacterium lividum]
GCRAVAGTARHAADTQRELGYTGHGIANKSWPFEPDERRRGEARNDRRTQRRRTRDRLPAAQHLVS